MVMGKGLPGVYFSRKGFPRPFFVLSILDQRTGRTASNPTLNKLS